MKNLEQLYGETVRAYASYLQEDNRLLAEIYNNRLAMIFKAEFMIEEAGGKV
jgi:hypothetical protein